MIGRKLRQRYEIQKHLGDGSTATVYLAQDTRLGREVALKVLLPHVRETARKRFFQEAQAAAMLNHPNIMSLYDSDEEDGLHFLVVEYVRGQSLTDYIPSTPDMVVELGAQIAAALHYAHENHVIHRDIKPANIKVTPEGQVKIMDLGLALPREAKRVTAHGMVIGTPAYLSPEQAQGLKLDRRTDIYSLGVVLFEMATGKLPFDNDDIGALLLQQVRQSPPKPRDINPDIPMALENVILKALEKKPEHRYQSCQALMIALEASMARQSSRPIQPPTQVGTSTNNDFKVDVPAPTMNKGNSRITRVVLADDHNLLRKTLVTYLEQQDNLVVVGEASDGDAAVKQTVSLLPDILILDLNMPGLSGLEVLTRIRAEATSVKVIVLTGREEDWYIIQALRQGANGYILKSGNEDELVQGIQKVLDGQLVLGQGVAERMVDGLIDRRGDSVNASNITEVERQLLLYVAGGYENDQIAKRLQIPLPTLIETLARTMNKLGAKDRHKAALIALRNNIISLEQLHEL